MLGLIDLLLGDAENLQRLQAVLDVGRGVVEIRLGGFQILLGDGAVFQQFLRAIQCALGELLPVARLPVGGDGVGDIRTGHVKQRIAAFTCAPVSTRMREIGPLTWVMACVVWSASQSTVPVVWIAMDQFEVRTGIIRRCGSCSRDTVKRPGWGRAWPSLEALPFASLRAPHAVRNQATVRTGTSARNLFID